MRMTSIAFAYTPLEPQHREIRVLTLLPGNKEEPVKVDLTTKSLNSGPIYNALSYVWGDLASAGKLGNTIMIDGHEFPVTANLLSALRHLRPPFGARPTIFWVDAVCINQEDLDERRQQVSMMRDIYASADRVVIWLGDADDESDGVFDALPTLAAQSCPKGIEKIDERLSDTMRRCSGFFSALPDHRPWFSRVWIIQELAMAKRDPLVACGWKSVSWSTFMKAWKLIARAIFAEMDMIHRKELRGDVTASDTSPIGQVDGPAEGEEETEILAKIKIDILDDLYKVVQSEGGETLRKLFLIARSSEATDPRDRIYALLGLLKPDTLDPRSKGFIDVDYRKPAAAVYADAMAHIFSQGDGPYFLSSIFLPGVGASAPHIPSLPATTAQPDLLSWVPDFSRQVAGKATQPCGTVFHPPADIGASGAGAGAHNGKQLEDNRTLQVEGLFVDTIEEVLFLGTSSDSYVKQLPNLEVLASLAMRRPCQLESSIRTHMERFKGKEPLWRVMISNKPLISGYATAPSSYEAMYLSLLDKVSRGNNPGPELAPNQQSEYEQCLRSGVGKKSCFTTKSGFVGTCVPDSRQGDIVAILFGSPVPFVLRPEPRSVQVAGSGPRSIHSLVGASYVGGIMGGEMVDELYCEDLMDSTTFFIQ